MTTTRTRWLTVLAVLATAPWFAEMSWGGYPVTYLLPILLFLAPLYGCAALLIHDLARQAGRGWPSMLLLGAAFGVLQAGVVDQSLFNPAYGRFDFQHPVHVDGIDVSLYYLLAFVAGHVVASTATPIFLAETWRHHGTEPWLSRRALRVVAVVYVLASIVNYLGVKEDEGHGFQARPSQTLAALAAVVALGWIALRWRPRASTDRRVPRPWILMALGFVAYLLYLPGEGVAAFAVGVVVVTTMVVAVGTWSRSRRWTGDHTVWLATGTILVGLVAPFWNEAYDDTVSPATQLLGDAAAATICLAVVTMTLWRRRVAGTTATTSGP